MPAPKLLVVTRHSPLPANDGAGSYLFDLLRYLRERGASIEVVWVKAEGSFVQRGWWRVPRSVNAVARVTVVGSLAIGRFRFFWWGPMKAQVLGVIKATLVSLGLWPNSRSSAGNRLPSASASRPPIPISVSAEPSWSELPSANETNFFRERLRTFRPDGVLANYCWLLPLVPRNISATKFVLTHDVASHRLNLVDPSGTNPSGEYNPATFSGETRLLDMADVVLAISEDDAAVFRGMVPARTVLLVPKAAEIQSLEGVTTPGRCLFVGGVNAPNREGLAWFLERIWPQVRQEHPAATLHICGGICQTVSEPTPAGVTLRGRVESLNAEYSEAEVVVVPLLRGTGVKIKLVEACSYGRACVTTPVGLQGLGFLRESVLESVEPAAFVTQVVRLLTDSSLRKELQRRSKTAVQAHLSTEQCYASVWAALNSPPTRAASRATALPRVPAYTDTAREERKKLRGQTI